MKKIPFNIKYRPEIESGKYKVVTRDDRPVRILCWNAKGEQPIVGLVTEKSGNELCYRFYEDGVAVDELVSDSDTLFLIVPKLEFKQGQWYLCTRTHAFFEKGEIYECIYDGTICDGIGRSRLTEMTYNIDYFSPLTEMENFEQELKNLIPDWQKDKEDFKKNTFKLFCLAEEVILKNIPKWQKVAEVHSFDEGISIRNTPDGDVLVLNTDGNKYFLNIKELSKLPKED